VRKHIQLQKARNEEKVNTVVAAHATLLEDWAMLEEEHTLALTEAACAFVRYILCQIFYFYIV